MSKMGGMPLSGASIQDNRDQRPIANLRAL